MIQSIDPNVDAPTFGMSFGFMHAIDSFPATSDKSTGQVAFRYLDNECGTLPARVSDFLPSLASLLLFRLRAWSCSCSTFEASGPFFHMPPAYSTSIEAYASSERPNSRAAPPPGQVTENVPILYTVYDMQISMACLYLDLACMRLRTLDTKISR